MKFRILFANFLRNKTKLITKKTKNKMKLSKKELTDNVYDLIADNQVHEPREYFNELLKSCSDIWVNAENGYIGIWDEDGNEYRISVNKVYMPAPQN